MNTNKLKRPPSVWIAQILLSVLALVFLLVPLLLVVANVPESFVLIYIFVLLVFVAVPIASVVGMAKRKDWGRWLAVVFLTFFVVSMYLISWLSSAPVSYEGWAQYAARRAAFLITIGLLLILVLRLAFAERVSQFFSKTEGLERRFSRLTESGGETLPPR